MNIEFRIDKHEKDLLCSYAAGQSILLAKLLQQVINSLLDQLKAEVTEESDVWLEQQIDQAVRHYQQGDYTFITNDQMTLQMKALKARAFGVM